MAEAKCRKLIGNLAFIVIINLIGAVLIAARIAKAERAQGVRCSGGFSGYNPNE